MGPIAKTENGPETKIPKNKGYGGVIIQNSPLAVTLLFFIRFPKYFRLMVKNKLNNLKIMVKEATFYSL